MRKTIYKLKQKIKSILTNDKKEKRHSLVGAAINWKLKQQFQINFLKSQGIKPEDVFLDIGCGTLRGGIPIIEYLDQGNYFGIDIRDNVIKEAKKELKEENLNTKEPTILKFDDFKFLELDSKFDKILAFSVLIHLKDDIVNDCMQFVSKYLKTNESVFYANVNYGDRPDGSWSGFPVVFRSFDFYKNLAKKYGMTVSELGDLKSHGHLSGDKLSDRQMLLAFTIN